MGAAYFDCTCGISGNMVTGAFLDMGMPVDYLEDRIVRVLPEWSFGLEIETISLTAGTATYFNTTVPEEAEKKLGVRTSGEVIEMILRSRLEEPIKKQTVRIFESMVKAKARAHGCSESLLKYSGESLVDTLIDIIGAVSGLEYFGIGSVISTPIQVGSGKIRLWKGDMDIPAPMTRILLKGAPYYSTGMTGEMATPTGAAIITNIAERFGFERSLSVNRAGYGAATVDSGPSGILKVYL
jgi:hypothetical protein